MKLCACCGCIDSVDQPTCAICGEASWVLVEARVEDEPQLQLVEAEPEAKPRKGRK